MSARTSMYQSPTQPSRPSIVVGGSTTPRSLSRLLISKSSMAADNTKASMSKQMPLELRCHKHSPRVKVRKDQHTTEDNHAFEALAWREAFSTMGRLAKLNLKEVTPFTTLNEAPYHCLSLSRKYKVRYGKISHVEGGTVKGIVKPVKETKVSACNCVEAVRLLRIPEPTRIDKIAKRVLSHTPKEYSVYMPISAVVVRWNDRRYDGETICEWLQQFGYFQTLYKGCNLVMVVFNDIKNAYSAVKCFIPNSGISITWNNLKFHNYGHFRMFENYNLAKDGLWQSMVARQKKRHALFKASGKRKKAPRKEVKF